jgi:hypothetical protein
MDAEGERKQGGVRAKADGQADDTDCHDELPSTLPPTLADAMVANTVEFLIANRRRDRGDP